MKVEELTVTGMTCASCSARVERVVGKLAGVKSASVNLATEKLSLQFDESVLSEEQVAEAVRKAGYGIAPKQEEAKRVTIPIEGMTCASCVARIEKAGKSPSAYTVEIKGDSQLVINQAAGNWKVKQPHLRPLKDEAVGLLNRFKSFQLTWQPREESVAILGH